MATGGRNETLTLKGGHLLALSHPPGEKWRISALDRPHSGGVGETVSAPNGAGRTSVGVLTRYELPKAWAEMRFDSVDEAVAFVESEIAAVAK